MSNQINVAVIVHPSDTKVSNTETKPWLDTLQRNLSVRLQQLTGCFVKMHVFTAISTLEINAEEGLLFDFALPIYSNHFYHSEDCIELTKIIQNQYIHTHTQTIALFRHELDEESLPMAIYFHERYLFFKRDTEIERLVYFAPGNVETERQFWAKIDDCATYMYSHWSQIDQTSNTESTDETSGITVFLAECSTDMGLYRDILRRDLIDKGVQVLPEKNLPNEISELNVSLKNMLKKCDFSIHLLGTEYGRIPEGSNRSVVEIQNDLAEEILNLQDKKRFVWLPDHLIVHDERQRILIEDAKTSMKTLGSAEVVIGVIEIFKDLVSEMVWQISEQKLQSKTDENTDLNLPKLYVVCDYLDKEFLENTQSEIEELGCKVLFSAFEKTEQEIRKMHMTHLRECDGLLFYFNQGNEKWLQTRMVEIQRVKAYGRTKKSFYQSVAVGSQKIQWIDKFHNHQDLRVFNFSENIPLSDIAIWIRNWNLN